MSPSEDTFQNEPSEYIPDLSDQVICYRKKELRLIERVGIGAWGVVYRAETVEPPHTPCAVKCIAYGMLSRRQRRAIAREVILHEKICATGSPRVVEYRGAVEDDDSGLLFIITELCHGGNLLDRITAGTYLGNDALIKHTFDQILDAVDTCHNAGIYHRDLKPENILLKDKTGNNVVLGDFGFATESEFTEDYNMGSEPFMSPEIRGSLRKIYEIIFSSRADIWALGVILMTLVTGCIPWKKASFHSDEHFRAYYKNPDWLYQSFHISSEANEIFKSIFVIDPLGRTSITALRERIQKVTTFSRPKPAPARIASFFSVSSDECVRNSDPSTTRNESTVNLRVINGPPASRGSETSANHDRPNSDSDSDSDADSEGPVTPETRPADGGAPVVLEEIAELDLGDKDAGLISAFPVPPRLLGKVAPGPSPKRPPRRQAAAKPVSKFMICYPPRVVGGPMRKVL